MLGGLVVLVLKISDNIVSIDIIQLFPSKLHNYGRPNAFAQKEGPQTFSCKKKKKRMPIGRIGIFEV